MKHIPERICTVIMLVLLAVGATYVACEHDMELEKQKMLNELKQEFMTEPEVEIVMSEPEPTEPEEIIVYCEPVIDFVGLQKQNSDIYAWIQVPGTEIDYPVLQSEEDNYYLNRNVDDSKGYPGCIYTNKCNAKDFSDFVTVVYGHNMKNGSMFAGLHLFEDEEFFGNNEQIVIYTADARYTYQIYAAAAYNDVYIPAMYEVKLAEGAEAFRNSVEEYEDERKILRENMTGTEGERLLVLSTCIANEETKRYLVVGKLVETAFYTQE